MKEGIFKTKPHIDLQVLILQIRIINVNNHRTKKDLISKPLIMLRKN
uniref:Protein yipf3-like protein n=1 Tax=Triatoma infestans TaxID=30076 RepID=A0A170YVQ3_TRIIF